ncbi:12324_t:CDS:2 [Cetraspora pellucida]|uniref:12324_t:CDS:1 n=1 Tax=Cetraspora pellucida TaxID=1433469 RepID=A0A9N9H7J1_9GLOM|nr:12324_t:CDS:2 [Cetraspora pellucida]
MSNTIRQEQRDANAARIIRKRAAETNEQINHSNLNLSTIQALKNMLDEVNLYIINLQHISYLPAENSKNLSMLIYTNIPRLDQRTHNAPSLSEVAAIWVDNDFSRCYNPLAYLLLFPNGEQGWAPYQILYRDILLINELIDIDEAPEAVWRILGFNMNRINPAITCLQVHLCDQQRINFNKDNDLEEVIEADQNRYMKTVNDYNLPELSQINTAELPRTILEELSYHITQEDLDKANTLNKAQCAVFDKVLDLINKDKRVFHLDANMQVSPANDKKRTFVEYLLRIGNGTEPTIDNDLIRLPDEMTVRPQNQEDSIDPLINIIYSNLTENFLNTTFITERAILTSLNSDVDEINEKIMAKYPGEQHTYYSFDSVPENNLNLFPIEYLNSLISQGLSSHEFILKH